MKNLFKIIFLLFATALFSQGGPTGDRYEFTGAVSTSVRNSFDVPTGKYWLILNTDTNLLEISGDDEVWTTVGDGIQEGQNIVTATTSIASSAQNQIVLRNDGAGIGIDLAAGSSPDGVALYLRDNQIEAGNYSIADIEAGQNSSLTTKEWVLSKIGAGGSLDRLSFTGSFTTVQRDAIVPGVDENILIYNSDTQQLEFLHEGGTWTSLSGGGSTQTLSLGGTDNKDLTISGGNTVTLPTEKKLVKRLTQAQFDALNPSEQNDPEIFYFIVDINGGVFFYDNNSGSILPVTEKAFDETATTSTITTNEEKNGGQLLLRAVDGTYTKTASRAGSGVSNVYALSNLGYMRMSSGDVVRLGNADMTIGDNHFIAILVRLDRSLLTGISKVGLLTTTQDDGSGNKLFDLSIGGSLVGDASSYAPFIRRAGRSAGSPSSFLEYIPDENSWGTTPKVGIYKPTTGLASSWVWICSYGKSEDSSNTNYATFLYNGGSKNFQPRNTQAVMSAIHGVSNTIGGLFWRKVNAPRFDFDNSGDGIFPISISGVDLVIDPGVDIDIARVIGVEGKIKAEAIAAIMNGAELSQVHEKGPNDFSYDFGSLPSIATVTAGAVQYTPLNDGPSAYTLIGTNAVDLVVSFANKTIQ